MQVVSFEEYTRHNRNVVLSENGQLELPEEWDYEAVPDFDEFDEAEALRKQAEMIGITPSEFVEFAVKMPDKKAQKHVNFSFAGRDYLKLPYNTGSKRRLFKCGRQVEKSTLLGNKCLAYSCIINAFSILYVSPSNQQTKTFSTDRLREPMETSDILKAWTTSKLSDSVFQKQFINRSKITLRYAYHNADRCRGIPADLICIDEIQDILTDNIPVIEECASHSPFKLFIYSGTPKSFDNPIEKYWQNFSTQNEWVVPCERHGVPGDPSTWFWNVLGEENIGKEGLICSKCGGRISSTHPQARWAMMNPSVLTKLAEPYEGFRVPQLMVPWLDWHEILDKYKKTERGVFYNEVLGLSYDSGLRPLTRQDVIDNCKPGLFMSESSLRELRHQIGGSLPVFAGIDWGTGEGSYTVLSLGTYLYDGRFTIFYIHRFEGPESEPQRQLELIEQILRYWNVTLVGCDYGGGYYQNDHLIRRLGKEKVWKYQYSNPGRFVKWEPDLNRFLVNRTEVMSSVFNAIKRRNFFNFLDWQQFEEPFGSDFLSIFSEYNEQMRQLQYQKSPDATDDSFHSILYCLLVSMMRIQRLDIFDPNQKSSVSQGGED